MNSQHKRTYSTPTKSKASWLDESPPYTPNLPAFLRSFPDKVATALKEIRAVQKLSIDAIAREAKVCPDLWLLWEQGLKTPEIQQLEPALRNLAWIWYTSWRLLTAEAEKWDSTLLWQAMWKMQENQSDNSDPLFTAPMSTRAYVAFHQYLLASDEKAGEEPHLESLRIKRVCSEQSIGSFLRYRRELLDASIEDMSAKAGVTTHTWRAWEAGTATPSYIEAINVAPRLFSSDYLRNKMLQLCKNLAA